MEFIFVYFPICLFIIMDSLAWFFPSIENISNVIKLLIYFYGLIILIFISVIIATSLIHFSLKAI